MAHCSQNLDAITAHTIVAILINHVTVITEFATTLIALFDNHFKYDPVLPVAGFVSYSERFQHFSKRYRK